MITAQKLAPGSVTMDALDVQLRAAITDKLPSQSTMYDNLPITPIQSVYPNGVCIQQFGISPFQFHSGEETVQVHVELDRAFLTSAYVIVATTNHFSCYAAVSEQCPERFTITVVRRRIFVDLDATLNWIAIGQLASQ